MRQRRKKLIALLTVVAAAVAGLVGTSAAVGAAAGPVIAVSPHANLRDHQGVTVSGIQYAPGSAIAVRQCALSTGRCRLRHTDTTADTQGMFAVRGFEVRRLITRPDGAPIDCAVVECRIRVTSTGATVSSLTRILTFDPAAAFDPAPTLTVTPSTGLADSAQISATYRRFAPGERLTIRVCRLDPTRDVCDVGVDDFASATGSDNFGTEIHRRITDASRGEFDCADPVGRCVFEVFGHSSGDVAAAGITFDAATPLPIVTVDGGTDLPFRGTVQAHGRGLAPNTLITAAMCADRSAQPVYPSSPACAPSVRGMSDAGGRLDLTVPFRRRVHTYTLDISGLHEFRFDCAAVGTTCSVGFSGGSAPVTFDPAAPIPPPPTIVVTPSRNLPALTTVSVTGSGFLPDRNVAIGQCDPVSTSTITLESCAAGTTMSDGSGRITTTVTVRRLLGATDCATAIGRCVLRATTDPGDFGATPEATEVVRTQLGFDPNAPPITYPVSVTPSTGLIDRQPVTVTGSNFPAGSAMAIYPCTAAAANDSTSCDRDAGQFFTADASGAFRQTFAVHQILQMGDGSAVDCNDAPGSCVLWVGVPSNSSIATKVPLSFAAQGPTPVVTARSRSITEPTGTNHATAIDFVLSEPTDHVVRVHWRDNAYRGTADVNADYVGVYNGVVDIFPGQTRASTFLDVVGDRIDEPDEWLPITLFSPAGATVGPDARLTIRDDDAPPTARLGDASVKEQNAVRFAEVPVRLSVASGFPVTVRFTTHQFTARAGSDYIETTGTLTIPAGETIGNIALVILGDRVHESTETLLVTIDQPNHATIADGDAVLTITDDD